MFHSQGGGGAIPYQETKMSDDVTRIPASEIKDFTETGEGLKEFHDILKKALNILTDEGGATFILGKVVIVNDLEEETEED